MKQENNLQKHLDHSMYGNRLINPEEQKKLMGTFRERCYVTMTIAQMRKEENKKHFNQELIQHINATVLLNGSIDQSLQISYIKLCNEKKVAFTIINDCVSNTPDTIGIILTAKEAVNEKKIDIEEKYPPTPLETSSPKNKKKLFSRWFH